jgi:hypothetical protein
MPVGSIRLSILFFFLIILPLSGSLYAQVPAAPDRRPNEGEGPFPRMIIRGATMIDGTGAPPQGPVDIVVEGNRTLRNECRLSKVRISDANRPKGPAHEIDARGACMSCRDSSLCTATSVARRREHRLNMSTSSGWHTV